MRVSAAQAAEARAAAAQSLVGKLNKAQGAVEATLQLCIFRTSVEGGGLLSLQVERQVPRQMSCLYAQA